ncbi:ATP-dependent DNA ligase [Rhizobium sp. BK049]|nr:ATP-dependent DNA ligase [Rhizobium sp. BK049]
MLAITGPARRPGISALLVAVQREGQLVYVGSVGTGFKAS